MQLRNCSQLISEDPVAGVLVLGPPGLAHPVVDIFSSGFLRGQIGLKVPENFRKVKWPKKDTGRSVWNNKDEPVMNSKEGINPSSGGEKSTLAASA